MTRCWPILGASVVCAALGAACSTSGLPAADLSASTVDAAGGSANDLGPDLAAAPDIAEPACDPSTEMDGVIGMSPTAGHLTSLALDDDNVYWTDGDTDPICAGYVVKMRKCDTQPTVLHAGKAPDIQQPCNVAVDAGFVYWTAGCAGGAYYPDLELGTIWRVPVSGGSASVLEANVPNPSPYGGLAVWGGFIYWATNGWFEGPQVISSTVMKAPIAGGTPTLLYTAPAMSTVNGIATDSQNVYAAVTTFSSMIAPNGTGFVASIPLAGGAATMVSTALVDPEFPALDSSALYWLDMGPYPMDGVTSTPRPGAVWKADPATPGSAVVLAHGNNLGGVVVGLDSIYFGSGYTANTPNSPSTILSVSKSGGAVAVFMTLPFGALNGWMAVDATHLYWSDPALNRTALP